MRRNVSSASFRLDDIIHLQPRGGSELARYSVRVIGVADGRSLIVVPAGSMDSRGFVLGEQYVARCLSGKSVYGFTTDAIKVAIDPYSYLHLSYPQEVQSVGVRQSERVRVSIPVAVRVASGEIYTGTIIDLSPTGAQVASGFGPWQVGDKVALTFDAGFAGVTNKLESTAVVRSVREDAGKSETGGQWLHGVHFDAHDEQQRLILHGVVYEQIALRRAAA